MPDQPPGPNVADAAAGAGVGLLLGLLLGLSVSPLVQGVVVAITGLLGAMLGLQQGNAGRSARIAGFGFLCAAGVVLGLWLRSGSALQPSVKQSVTQWTDAGYPPDRARDFVAYQRLGIAVPGATTAENTETKAHTTVLFSSESKSACNAIGLLSDPAEKLALARRMGFAAAADQAATAPNPAAALQKALACGA